ncbi:zinc metallochaperone AztD [Nocardiopsis sp. CT-R113]|uniref:Zinc metallochaperone AztD n=1 Tax=Nocardiopsis codii TaxID=3065942 RepID=A0ABU7KCD2_9ACTN|nr:zinc metallochaperone AztD [Nocardiopsis sp. CT-R113]MEE2039895.1 zinc metallochaperone AztD [Nocardiopsis sp. CT-R113]
MRTSHTATKAALPVVLSAGLLLTACSTEPGGTADETPAAADTGASVTDPIAVTYDGGVLVLDGDTLEVAGNIDLEGFNRLNPAGDDRHLFVSTADGFQVLDAAAGELTDTVFPADTPGHVVRHAGRTVLFADGSGEVTSFDTDALGEGTPGDLDVYTTEEAHHGVAVELENGELLVTLGNEEERVGAVVLDADREEVARSEECPGVHGETTAEGETVVIGCEDGALMYRDGEFTKVDSEHDYGRIGNQAGTDSSPVVLGDYKTDPDAELERPERVALIDSTDASLSLVDLPSSYTFRSLGRGPQGEALVLGTDGSLHVIDQEEGEIVDSVELMDAWEEPLEWQQPRPALFVRGETAYVTDTATRQIHAVDLGTGEVTASTTLEEVPNELSGVTS